MSIDIGFIGELKIINVRFYAACSFPVEIVIATELCP